MNKMVLGKYLPLDSIFHKMDPRAKIIALLLMLVAIFINAGWWGYGLLLVVMSISIKLAKMSFSFVLKALKPMMFMLFFLLVVNVLVVKQGTMILDLGFIQIYDKAVFDTLYIVVRLVLMIMISSILTCTTKPFDLTMGIERLLKPFGRIGLPYHELSMMISIALRFIPTIIEETMRIMNAQKSRGVDFEEGKFKEKIVAILSLIVPLFAISLNRALDLANAMEARSYVPGKERTRYHVLKYELRDFILIAIVLVLIGLLFAISKIDINSFIMGWL